MRRGLVVGILWGDTLAIKMIDLSATRLGSPDGRNVDEPGAWPSFGFLRLAALSPPVLIQPGKGPTDQKRLHPNFGQIPVTFGRATLVKKDSRDVGSTVVEAGWAPVRSPRIDDDYLHQLLDLQDAAREAATGVWTPTGLVRSLPLALDPPSLLHTKDFDGVINF
jgi:hypothetical protein